MLSFAVSPAKNRERLATLKTIWKVKFTYNYFNDNLASRSVASRSPAYQLNLKISPNFFEKSKGGKISVSDFHEIDNLKSF